MNPLRIQTPCSENWNNMTPTDKGAFCQSCCKEVIDFSNKSADQIKRILLENSGKEVCGRFESTQIDALNLDFEMWNQPEKWTRKHIIFYAFLLVFGLSLVSCNNQEEQQQLENYKQTVEQIVHRAELDPEDSNEVKELTVAPEQIIPDERSLESFPIWTEAITDTDNIIREDQVYDLERITHIAGGIGYSVRYAEYLRDTVPEVKYDHLGNPIPTEFGALAYPNPTSGRTTIKFEVPDSTYASFAIYNMMGEQIFMKEQESFEPGTYELPFDLTDLPTGTYLIMVLSEQYKESVRVVKI